MSSAKRRWTEQNHYARHYCKLCNSWMSSDRMSILKHENGAKHQRNLQLQQTKKRETEERAEQQQKLLSGALAQMNAGATASISSDYSMFAASASSASLATLLQRRAETTSTTTSSSSSFRRMAPVLSTSQAVRANDQKSNWQDKKKLRESKKRPAEDTDEPSTTKRPKVPIGDQDGFYHIGNKTWLEGIVFGDILEDDMPVQLWRGPTPVPDAELRLVQNDHWWRDALVARIRSRPTAEKHADRMVLDVAFLEDQTDTEETLCKSVPLQHVRLLLGNPVDDRIPNTCQEARLLALGGEEVDVPAEELPTEQMMLNEDTGFTGWSTVSIKRTTLRNELKAERDLERANRREAARNAAQRAKEAEARKMEEAKVSNADDSALGAYDIWSRTKDGYKGVDIHSETKVDVQELGKKLSDGKGPVGFKKSKFKKKKKQNRRTTSADDD